MLCQVRHRPISCGIFFKGELYQRSPFRIEDHGSFLAALIVDKSDVLISNRSFADCAAALYLLPETFFDFGCKVLRVEFSDGTHNAV